MARRKRRAKSANARAVTLREVRASLPAESLAVEEQKDALALLRAWLEQQEWTINPRELGPEYQNQPISEDRQRMLAAIVRIIRSETARPMGKHGASVNTYEDTALVMLAERIAPWLSDRKEVAKIIESSLGGLSAAQRRCVSTFEPEGKPSATTTAMGMLSKITAMPFPKRSQERDTRSVRTLQAASAALAPHRASAGDRRKK